MAFLIPLSKRLFWSSLGSENCNVLFGCLYLCFMLSLTLIWFDWFYLWERLRNNKYTRAHPHKEQEDWTRYSLKVPSNTNNSVILWFWEYVGDRSRPVFLHLFYLLWGVHIHEWQHFPFAAVAKSLSMREMKELPGGWQKWRKHSEGNLSFFFFSESISFEKKNISHSKQANINVHFFCIRS